MASTGSTDISSAGSGTPASPPGDHNTDWADSVTDLFVEFIDSVRDKTTGPILMVARGIVYGIVALIILSFVGIASLILLGRLTSLIPIPQWISYLAVGSIFIGIGMILWSKRGPVS